MEEADAIKQIPLSTRPVGIASGFVLLAGFPSTASAHVKWFTHANVHDATVRPSVLLSPIFAAIFAAAIVLVFAGFLLDGWIATRWPEALKLGGGMRDFEERLIRAATGAYFIFTSSVGGIILTPDLHSDAAWIPALQFGLAVCLIWRRSCIVAGTIIIFLYGYAVHRYGVFYLVDYLFMPALAVFLASLSLPWPRLTRHREVILSAGLAFSLAWTAIEKFLYPQWTDAVITTHPIIGMGEPMPWVVVIAGFIEFTLAFYMITGRGLLRIGGIGYIVVFMGAMAPFGKLDIFGHLIIVAILLITVLRGTTAMQDAFHWRGRGTVFNAAWITALYPVSMALFFAAYYALQRTTAF